MPDQGTPPLDEERLREMRVTAETQLVFPPQAAVVLLNEIERLRREVERLKEEG